MTRARITVSFIVMLVICAIALMGAFIPSSVAYAAGTAYSDVLDDLHSDESFSEENYPVVADDYSLKVIQVAESVDDELFVYVYQPSGFVKPLKASSINISLVPRENISDVKNYKLRLLNSDGVFFKYLVEGLTVGTATTRYYTIPSIFRPYDETIDEGADHGNEITEVVYEVAKEYCFSTINGEPFCRVLDIETIEITDKFVGFVRYSNGFELYPTRCDSHFVAFNTDRDIDRLFEAEVFYTTQSYSYSYLGGLFGHENETFGEVRDNYAHLYYEEKVEHTGDGLWAPTYTWNRIETVENFIAGEDIEQTVYTGALLNVSVANKITDEGRAALAGKKWVLRCTDTEYSLLWSENSYDTSSTIVGDVTILRLKFETDGVTYNLGVVDNKQSGDPDTPINEEEIKAEPSDIMKLIMLIIGIVFIVVLLVIIAPVLPYVIKFVIWLICLPFRAIAKLIDAAKKPKETGTVQNARKKKPAKTVSQTKRK